MKPCKAIVTFHSDSTNEYKGFDLSWHTNCGGNLFASEASQSFASSNYPMPYQSKTHCHWLIRTASGFENDKIYIEFTHFDTYADPDESWDCANRGHYVQIYEGSYPKEFENLYCGSEMPDLYISKGNQVTVVFDSQNGPENAERTGFQAIYTAGQESCGSVHQNWHGSIQSPGYSSGAYKPNLQCTWTLISSPGNRVELKIDEMDLEDSDDCSKDFLAIYRGEASNHELISKLCADQGGRFKSEPEHSLYLRFVTDDTIEAKGFRASYEMHFGQSFEPPMASGKIASPLWPNFYPPDVEAEWTVNTKEDFNLIHWDLLEFDVACPDSLAIYDGENDRDESTAQFHGCGIFEELPSTKLHRETTKHQLKIKFISNKDHLAGKGFLLNWYAIPLDDWDPNKDDIDGAPVGTCGYEPIIASNYDAFLIQSPGFPVGYEMNQNCIWKIAASKRYSVEFFLQFLDMEVSHDCSNDWVKFFDGYDTTDPLLYKGCEGKDFVPIKIKSTVRYMTIEFHTSNHMSTNGHRVGFNGTYISSCGGTIYGPEGVVDSHHYPENYEPNLNCYWRIKQEPGHTSEIEFEEQFQVDGNGPYCNDTDYAGKELHRNSTK